MSLTIILTVSVFVSLMLAGIVLAPRYAIDVPGSHSDLDTLDGRKG